MMKSKLTPSSSLKRKTLLIYTAAGLIGLGLITWLVLIYLNTGISDDAFAAGNYASNRSGTWSTGSTWNGGASPTNNVSSNTNIIINSGHTVTVAGNLVVANTVSITVNGTGKLIVTGNFTANNTLTLMVNGEMTVAGNMTAGNDANVTANGGGKINIGANTTFGNNANVGVDGQFNGGSNITFGNNSNFRGNGSATFGGTDCSKWRGPGQCNDNTTLPIELLSFMADNSNMGVTLTWKTASELNNDHFTIGRSEDGITYTDIATVKGNGTSTTISEYIYVDKDPITGGVSYYRLSQTDFDGTSETFKPVAIQAESTGKKTALSVYPNPITGNTLHVKFANPVKGVLELVGGRGEKLLSKNVDGSSDEVELALDAGLQQGIYYLNYKTAKSTETIKLVK